MDSSTFSGMVVDQGRVLAIDSEGGRRVVERRFSSPSIL